MSKESRIDPICGMKGDIEAYGHYFCSKYCVKKYEKMHNIKEGIASCAVETKKLYKEKLFIVLFCLLLIYIAHLILISMNIVILEKLIFSFFDYLKKIWIAIVIGLLIGGIIDYFIPIEYISKYLACNKKRTIFYSVSLGFLMAACSHGILAISIELHKKGASVPSVIAFLLASPWANLPITIMLFGFFGIKALLFVLSAIVIAIITGFIYQLLDRKNLIEKNQNSVNFSDDFSIYKDVKKRFKEYKISFEKFKKDVIGILNGSWNLSKMVLWWVLIGMFLASLSSAYIPKHFFMNYMNANLLGLIVTLVFATVIEICSEGSSPLAFEIFKQTGAFGNSFVFLMAGVATDYTEIGLIWSNIGKRSALWLPIITVPQIVMFGYLFNILK